MPAEADRHRRWDVQRACSSAWKEAAASAHDLHLRALAIDLIVKGGRNWRRQQEHLLIPDDVLLSILALLPLPKLMQLRLVCTSWNNSLLRTPSLWQAWCSRQYCWLVMEHRTPNFFHKEFIVYCIPTSANTASYCSDLGGHYWMPLSRALMVSPHVRHLQIPLIVAADLYSRWLVAGAQGLMCFVLRSGKTPAIVLVVNILTGHTHILPSPHYSTLTEARKWFMSVLANPTCTNSYQILIYDKCFSYVEVYSSQSRSWRIVEKKRHDYTSNLQGGDVFSLSSFADEVHAYNLDSDEWSMVPVELPRDCNYKGALVINHNGRLLLAGVLIDPKLASNESWKFKGFGVWELQRSPSSSLNGMSWVPIAQTPPECLGVYHKFRPFVDTSIECEFKFVAFRSLIFLTGANFFDWKQGNNYITPLVYDLAHNSWFHLPDYKGSLEFIGLFAFQPSCSLAA